MKLLIPILIDALVVDDALNAAESESWARNADDYRLTATFQSPSATIFQQKISDAPTGVHLQWILPDALCHGERKSEDEEIEFHHVPNRWLVNRLHLNYRNEIEMKSWLVLSDFVQEVSGEPANYLYEKEGELIPAKLGKVIDLEDFEGDTGDEELFLTAIGAGNAAFNSFTPANENVFSFIDELKGFENSSLRFTYLVSGWYSNEVEMPDLSQLNFEQSENFEGKAMLCHGTIYGVNWHGKRGDVHKSLSGKPTTKNDIIIANSSFDAIVRLVQKQMMEEQKLTFEETKQTARLLAAFEHHCLENLDKNGGLSELQRKTHASWFGAEDGGTIWTIQTDKPKYDFQEELSNSDVFPLLDMLNELQIALDKQLIIKWSKQSELYENWIIFNKNPKDNDLKSIYENALKGFYLFENELKNTKKQHENLLSELNILLETLFNGKVTLTQTMQPKFWEANEPVVLIHAAKASDKYGFDKQLKTRISGETITNLKEYYSKQPIDFQPPTLPNLDKIPLEIKDLVTETILLNPDFAIFLHQKADGTEQTTTESIEKQQTLIWNNEIHRQLNGERLTELAGFSGKRPSLRAFSKCLPTWSPLFLDWEVNYYPNGHLKIDNWNLDGFKYKFNNDKNEFNPNKKITVSGRSLLSSQASKVLESNLKQFKKTLKEETEKLTINNVINIINKFDIVTQRLSGFNEMLLGLDINDIVPITNKYQELKQAVNGGELALPIDTGENYPLRSGFLIPKKIQIVDDFGLAITPFNETANIKPLILKGYGTAHEKVKGTNILLLPPRIVQPSRISMNWLGVNTSNPISIANDDNPIIGWIMVDYLDKSLEVFSPNGDNIGELMTFKRGDKTEVQWLNKQPFPNAALNDFIQNILNYPNSSSALAALMNSIDDSLMLNNSQNTHDDAFAMLIGRPLALVQAKIDLEVKGVVDKRLGNIRFPIQIGNQDLATNGVVGYYKNMDFSELYVLNDKQQSDYLRQATTEKIKIDLPLEVVLIIEPTGTAAVVSGILPVFELKLPTKFTKKAIENMSVSFRVGTIINEPNQLRLPKPTDSSRVLTWQQTNKENHTNIQTATEDAHFPKKRNVLSEGWLNVGK